MTTRKLLLALATIGLLGAVGYGLYWVGMDRGMKMADPAPSAAAPASGSAQQGAVDPATGKKVLYWHDPMVPGQKFDKPGKSPFMDMQLVPVYGDGDGDQGTVTISPRVQQNLGVRTTAVTTGSLSAVVEAVGTVAYNERDLVVVQARSNGYVEKLYVRAALDAVRKGQPLADLYVPEWVAAQEEYLSVRRMTGTQLEALVDGARQRMRLAGMTDEQIRLVESTGKVHARSTVSAPISGVVTELGAREGMAVMAGATLFRINGLDTVWVNAEVREAQASEVRPGNLVEARTPALPGTTFKGRVNAILPEVNAATRTLKARVELANPGAQLVPGMFATVNFTPAARKEALLVPSEALIHTGRRSVVIVAEAGGRFRAAEVVTGMEDGDRTEVLRGLEDGAQVVVSGQFLIDSEASLKTTLTRLDDSGPAESADRVAGVTAHAGKGRVTAIDAKSARLTIEHGPIATLDWPGMTMGFAVKDAALLANIRPGQQVEFEFAEAGDDYVISRIVPAGQ